MVKVKIKCMKCGQDFKLDFKTSTAVCKKCRKQNQD